MNILTIEKYEQFKALLYVLYPYKDHPTQLDTNRTASKLAVAIAHYLEDYCNFECIYNKDDKAITLSKGKYRLDMQIIEHDGTSPSWYIYPSNVPFNNTSIIIYLADENIINI